jgi:hypothetical protein
VGDPSPSLARSPPRAKLLVRRRSLACDRGECPSRRVAGDSGAPTSLRHRLRRRVPAVCSTGHGSSNPCRLRSKIN